MVTLLLQSAAHQKNAECKVCWREQKGTAFPAPSVISQGHSGHLRKLSQQQEGSYKQIRILNSTLEGLTNADRLIVLRKPQKGHRIYKAWAIAGPAQLPRQKMELLEMVEQHCCK